VSRPTDRAGVSGLRRRFGSAGVAATVILLGLSVRVPAVAADLAPTPANGTFELDGRGYGHGRGMSQWGARGAADSGLTWQQILAFYYPGTSLTGDGGGSIRVWISADADQEMRVDPGQGLRLSNAGSTVDLPPDRIYRVVRSGAVQQLQYWDGARYQGYDHPSATGSTLELAPVAGLLRLVMPDGSRLQLRGVLRAVSDGDGLRSVAVMPMEDYLRGVVPAEMPSGWHLEALTAQAVAARSYAARLRADAGGRGWDTCDTVACQVFRGTATYFPDGTVGRGETPRTDEAVGRSAGQVLTHGAAGRRSIAFTEFSASNGGWTAAGGQPYLPAKPDPYDGYHPSAEQSWSASVPAARIESAYPSVGSLQGLEVTRRDGNGDWGGRVLEVRLTGSRGSALVTGAALRSALGLRSTWWIVTQPSTDSR
jgi:stage II sporulation protein D